MTARATFKQSDLDRAVKVMLANGIPFGGVEISDGKVLVLAKDEMPQIRKRRNSVDDILGA